jgi:uncharacterized membrane protein SirB2
MTYLILKTIHVLAAATTISGFLLRGYWMLTESDKLQYRVVRIVPHVVDTVFLLSGVAMVWMLDLNPFTQPWLIALVGAVSVFAYIAGVAFTKSPFSWIAVTVTS